MLWSLLKILFFVAIVAGLALGAGYLMETGSGVRIAVANTEFTLGPLQAAIALLLLLLFVWLAIRLAGLIVAILRFLSGDETALSRYFDRNRERKGYKALADSMMALASGESRLASVRAAKAEKYLARPELTNLITAQAAEMSGDRKKAEAEFKKLLADDRTRFVGILGLMKQKLAAGDTDVALKLAEKAFALKPKHLETQDTLLQLQAEQEDWQGARRTLGAKLKQGSLPRDVYRRRDAVLALSEASDLQLEGKSAEARSASIEANRLSPDLIPAAVKAAQAQVDFGKPKIATKILKTAWEVQPHPDLAAAFAAIAPEETPQARLKRFVVLTRIKPDHSETRMLGAELQIAAEDFPAARKALGDLTETDATARSLTIMAAIERGEGSDDAAVRAWLTKALTASRGPQWFCGNCNTVHRNWMPVCSRCSSFDTLSWSLPVVGEVAMPASTEMLPLIVGEAKASGDDIRVETEEPETESDSAEESIQEKSNGADPDPEAGAVMAKVQPPADYVAEVEVIQGSAKR